MVDDDIPPAKIEAVLRAMMRTSVRASVEEVAAAAIKAAWRFDEAERLAVLRRKPKGIT